MSLNGHGEHFDHSQHSDHMNMDHNNVATTTNTNLGLNIPMAAEEHSGHTMSGSPSLHSMMSMVFHFGTDEVVLFSWWEIKGVGAMVASFVGIFLIAMLYEGLKFYRDRLLCRTYSPLPYRVVDCGHNGVVSGENGEGRQTRPEGCLDKPLPEDDMIVIRHKMFSMSHGWQTFLHALQVTISYCLMLIFMTYNVWLCMAVVFGATFGYFIFGCRKSYVVDVTEHCH